MTLSRGVLIDCRLHKPWAIVMLLGFYTVVVAAPDDGSARPDNGNRPLKSLISIEESIKLRSDINEYSRTVDPAHIQIEERRRIMHQRLQKRFQQADIDNNKVISRDEAALYMPQISRHFDAIDTNNDGVITLEELEALQARILARQRSDAEQNVLEDLEPAKPKASDNNKR